MEGKKGEMKERKIVVAVDESEESMFSLNWCLTNLISTNQYNSNSNTSLILLYVKPPPPLAYSSLDATEYIFAKDAVATMEQYGRDLVNSVMTRAESVYSQFNTNIKVDRKVGSGEAKDVICTAVQKLGADILVMGSHDYGFFKRALLGSVSDYCAKHVKCPVVVVKRPKNL